MLTLDTAGVLAAAEGVAPNRMPRTSFAASGAVAAAGVDKAAPNRAALFSNLCSKEEEKVYKTVYV